jgi:hypothetical protein
VWQGKVSLDDPVEKVKSKVFKRVSLVTELGVLNTILETENFALVVNTHTICKSTFSATRNSFQDVISALCTFNFT